MEENRIITDDDEKAYVRGQEAEQFLQNAGQYYTRLMEEIKLDLFREIMSLSPGQKEEFSTLKSVLDHLSEPMNRVTVDIQLGRAAWERMNGRVDKTQGIL